MITANNKTSVILEQKIPDFVREEHDTFVQFMKSYYEFIELTNPPVDLPLVLDIPDHSVYSVNNPYGGTLLVGERLIQKASSDDPNEITTQATIFALTGNSTAQTAVVTEISGTKAKFLKNIEIIGDQSGAKYHISKDVKPLAPGVGQASFDLATIRDLDTSLASYDKFILDEIAANFPEKLHEATDKKTVLKNIRDFYRARGTENSFNLLFRLVYGEDVDIYLPQEDMLRPSVGQWQQRNILRTTIPLFDSTSNGTIPVTLLDLVGRRIRGKTSLATAIVENTREIVYLGFRFAELELSSKVGSFVANEIIQTTKGGHLGHVGAGAAIEVRTLGILSDIQIVDGGSNYAVGDAITITSEHGIGAIAQVSEVNANGSVTAVKIVDPGYNYQSAPTVTIESPHAGDIGVARFDTGPLETIFYEPFSTQATGNNLFAESDNRGGSSNVGVIGAFTSAYNLSNTAVIDPSAANANSYGNFVTAPGAKDGLVAWWRMNNYHRRDVRINTKDGTFGDGNDPSANTSKIGPRVGDALFLTDSRKPAFGYGDDDVLVHRPGYTLDPAVANTYSSADWVGFKPVVFDATGNEHHAYLKTRSGIGGGTFKSNVYTQVAFANSGIFGASSNSFVTGPNNDQTDLGGMVLMPHDDIRNANTQTWVFWYYPYGEFGSFGGAYNNDAAWASLASTSGSYNAYLAPRIIDRGHDAFWSLSANIAPLSVTSGDYIDCIFAFNGATLDNGTSLDGPSGTGAWTQFANNSGYYPGVANGTMNVGGGVLRAQTWNMIALSIDYTNGVGNVYFFNTSDGLHCANGFAISSQQDSNTSTHTANVGGWPAWAGEIESRGVVLGGASLSANGDSHTFGDWPTRATHGQFDEVRYFDKALDFAKIAHLFKNPGAKFDGALSSDWAIINQGGTFDVTSPQVDFHYDSSANESKVLRVGDSGSGTDGLQIIHTKNIPFRANSHYKITIRAKDSSPTTASNAEFGIIGISNTGTSLIGYDGTDRWDTLHAIVQSGAGNQPSESGSLGPDWFTYTAVFGGNTSSLGWNPSISDYRGTGGNTAQEDAESVTFTRANPAKLFGSLATATQQGSGNAEFFRPILFLNSLDQNDSTLIDYIKIEEARDAVLTASVAGEFVEPGEFVGDAGKLSTSPANNWKSKFIQDNDFYQTYSYVIRSGLSLPTYKNLVKKLVHVAGKKLFGQVDIQSFGTVRMRAFSQTFSGNIIDLTRQFFLGIESSLIEDFASRPIGGQGIVWKSSFGLANIPRRAWNLDIAHGDHDEDFGDGPGWIAWDQSINDNPYAASHYTGNTAAYVGPYATSNSSTNVTKSSLIYNPRGYDSRLVSGYSNTAAGIGALDGQNLNTGVPDYPQFGAYGTFWQNNLGFPLDIDGGQYRYVRMKVRRVGPGGYGDSSWLGACQADTNPTSIGSLFTSHHDQATVDDSGNLGPFSAAANTIPQPQTLILPATASETDTSPWHILEWDMWSLGTFNVTIGTQLFKHPSWPANDPKTMWKSANAFSGSSIRDNPASSGRRIGWIGIGLSLLPDNDNEKFEIDWIQVDDGEGWPRGSYVYPAGFVPTSNSILTSTGTGISGHANHLRVAESNNADNIILDDLAVSVSAIPVPIARIGCHTQSVVYTHSDLTYKATSSGSGSVFGPGGILLPFILGGAESGYPINSSNGAIFRVSANTANSNDWITTEVIDSQKFLGVRDYIQTYATANAAINGPVILETDQNDNLFVGYSYEELNSYPGLTDNQASPRPLLLFKLSPASNVHSDPNEIADPHNLFSVGGTGRGRSNTYDVEQIMWGNTGGTEGVGVMLPSPNSLAQYGTDLSDEKNRLAVSAFVSFS